MRGPGSTTAVTVSHQRCAEFECIWLSLLLFVLVLSALAAADQATWA